MATKPYDFLIYIGRFQLPHAGHINAIEYALEMAHKVIVVVGSPNIARSFKNPFTASERIAMLKSALAQSSPINSNGVYFESSIMDNIHYPNRWHNSIIDLYNLYKNDYNRVGIIGHYKDESSQYIHDLKSMGLNVEYISNYQNISSTELRRQYFTNNYSNPFAHIHIPPSISYILNNFKISNHFANIREEMLAIDKYKEQWKLSPYQPIFNTVDATVVYQNKILLITRGKHPGKGLLAVPGGYLNANEGIHDGIIRELREETRLNIPGIRNLIEEVVNFDQPDRDQRGRLITFNGFIDLGSLNKLPDVFGSDDVSNAAWYDINSLKSHLFYADHYDMIQYMLARY